MSRYRSSAGLETQDNSRMQEEGGSVSVVSPMFVSPSFLSPQHRLTTESMANLTSPFDLSDTFHRQLSGLGDEEAFLDEMTTQPSRVQESPSTKVTKAESQPHDVENHPDDPSSPVYPIDQLILHRSGSLGERSGLKGDISTHSPFPSSSSPPTSPSSYIPWLVDYTRPTSSTSITTPTHFQGLHHGTEGPRRPASTSGIREGAPLTSSTPGPSTPRTHRPIHLPRSATPGGRDKQRHSRISEHMSLHTVGGSREGTRTMGSMGQLIQQVQRTPTRQAPRTPGFRSPRSFFQFSSPPNQGQSGPNATDEDESLDSWGIWEDPTLIGRSRLLTSPDYIPMSKRPRRDP